MEIKQPIGDPAFACKVCGKQCATAPADGSGAICPEHCEDHDYQYEPSERKHLCVHCNDERPYDWGIM